MPHLDPFTRAYLETAIWADLRDEAGESLDHIYGVEDIAPQSLAQAIEDCAEFQAAYAAELAEADDAHAGGDFWLTRNRHGAGYWDGDYPADIADRLTDGAHAYGTCYLDAYEGQVHIF